MTINACELTPARTAKLEHPQSGCSGVRERTCELLQSVWDAAAPELARLACTMGIDPSRAEDVLQDVYLTAWRKRPPGAGRTELRRWLFRVAANRCNLEHRRRARWRTVWRALAGRRGGSQYGGHAAEAFCRGEEKEMVRCALNGLEPQLRSVLVLRYFAEFDSKEIGRILEMPDSTVRSRLRAARKQLALELKRSGYSHD